MHVNITPSLFSFFLLPIQSDFDFVDCFTWFLLRCILGSCLYVFEKDKMGICSSQMSRKKGNFLSRKPSIMVFHSDGRLQEFNQPIRASHILSQHPNSFLCSSESMYVDSIVPQISEDEELELGQIYFVLPISQSRKVLTLQDLCRLAIKASLTLGFTTSDNNTIKRTTSSYNVNVAKLVSQALTSCRILGGFDAIGATYPHARRGQAARRIEF